MKAAILILLKQKEYSISFKSKFIPLQIYLKYKKIIYEEILN